MNNTFRHRCFLHVFTFILLVMLPSQIMAVPRYTRTIEEYTIPHVTMVNQEGDEIRLAEYLDTDKIVVLEFVFATCTTICPILTISLSNLQEQLGPEAETLRLVSISIDPEHDTPAVMKEYLQRYNAQPGWDFLTGSIQDVKQTMQAFDAYVSDKMGHRPLIFFRSPTEKKWVRIDGLLSWKELKSEYLALK